MGLVLDAGALIAFEGGDRKVAALIEAARRRGEQVVTSSGCVAQAWRQGGPRQARLARLLNGLVEKGLDARVSRRVGALCARAGSSDVVDAHLTLLARDGDVLVTSDSTDLRRLLRATGSSARLQPC